MANPEPKRFIEDGSVKWGQLTTWLIGVVLAAFGLGVSRTSGSLYRNVAGAINAYATFNARLIRLPAAVTHQSMGTAWAEAYRALEPLGPAAPLAFGVELLVVLTVMKWGFDQIR